MIRSLKGFFRRLWVSKPPAFQYLQVEMTTHCDLPGCLMCPRSAWPERWLHHDLSWLLHPRLWDMARAAHSQGCTVSLTTNGMNLTEAIQVQVLENLDMVAVSLDGATAETYERMRPGADFRRVTQQLAALCSRKRSLGRPRPEVVLLFMKMRPNVVELPDFLRLAAALGVDRVNATNLDFIPSPAMEGLTLVTPGPVPEIAAILDQTRRQARKFNLPFRNMDVTPVSDLIVCDANPLKNVIVTALGDLAPCVYLGLPVSGIFNRLFFQKSYPAQNYFYGNIEAQEFSEILQQPAYQEFTAGFLSRVTTSPSLMDNLVPNPRAPIRQDGGGKNLPIAEPLLPWPPACQGCYKSLGF